MHDQHSGHSEMSPRMMRLHYWMLALNLLVSAVIMYFVMFTMIWSAGDLFNNLNTFYMALMMVTPMGVTIISAM